MRSAVQCPRCSNRLPLRATYCNRCGFNVAEAGRRLAAFTGQGARVLRVGVIGLVLLIVFAPLVVSNCGGPSAASRVEHMPDGSTNVDVRSVGGCSASNTVHIQDRPASQAAPRSAV